MLWNGYKKAMTSLKWRWVRLLPFLCVVVPVWADVPAYPPQNVPSIQRLSTAPNGQTFRNVGSAGSTFLDMESKTLTYTPSQFGTVKPSSGGLVGTKTNPVNLYDNYGNVARGQVQTQTQIPGAGSSVMNKAITGLIVGDMAGKVMNSHGAQNAAKALAEGNYSEAALSAGAAFDVFDVGSGFNALKDIYRDAQAAKSQRVITEAEQAKAQAQQKYDSSVKKVWVHYLYYTETGQNQVFLVTPKDYTCCGGIKDSPNNTTAYLFNSATGESYPVPPYNYRTTHIRSKYVDNSPELYYRAPTLEDLLLTNVEMQQILMQQLADQNSVLNRNSEAMTQLINALWAGGHLGPGNTQSMVSGSPADNTFLTSPYTPAGSNQAQQTQFTINNNGTVTQTIVQRPDLAANTSQAPTRAEVGNHQQQGQQDTRPAKSDSTAEKPDICAQNPNSLMCAPMGNTDYQDLVLPQQNINIALSPLHIFNTDAACPAPTSFSIAGTQQRMSYEPMCDTARKARPFIIMMAMTAAFLMVFSALNRR